MSESDIRHNCLFGFKVDTIYKRMWGAVFPIYGDLLGDIRHNMKDVAREMKKTASPA